MSDQEHQHAFSELRSIIARLRAPDGCPWDREQTAETLRDSLIEEAYECVDAIVQKDDANLREELGDLYMLVTMIAYIKQQDGVFSVEDVLREVNAKLVRRHPHVFGDVAISSSDEVLSQWARIKVEVEGKPVLDSAIDGVLRSLPPLERAHKIQKKAAKVGFDWQDIGPVRDKVLEEFEETMDASDDDSREEELGDLLFSVVNLARFLKVNPSVALHRANEKFVRRFKLVEQEMRRRGSPMSAAALPEMDDIWNSLKDNPLTHAEDV